MLTGQQLNYPCQTNVPPKSPGDIGYTVIEKFKTHDFWMS